MQRTALYDWHVSHNAKMVSFAGYAMPLQYKSIVEEHLWTRAHVGLFDVSHMGQIHIKGAQAKELLSRCLPIDIDNLAVNQQCYGLLLNEHAGIEDDLMLTRRAQDYYLVVNAARKLHDIDWLKRTIPNCYIDWWTNRALLALQGPEAVSVITKIFPQIDDLSFMHACEATLQGEVLWISRSGYTGEDGFEISLSNSFAPIFAEQLLEDTRVKPIGLGARDSLRLEAGFCLYGQDIDSNTTPIEAGLLWAIQPSRRPSGRHAGGYCGAEVIATQLREGVCKKRVGFLVDSQFPIRAHTPILQRDNVVGEVTSGSYSPTLQAPIAMGYINSDIASLGQVVQAEVRGRRVDLQVTSLPFIKKNYKHR